MTDHKALAKSYGAVAEITFQQAMENSQLLPSERASIAAQLSIAHGIQALLKHTESAADPEAMAAIREAEDEKPARKQSVKGRKPAVRMDGEDGTA